MRACINKLPDDHRTILMLRDIEELDTDETARLLSLSRSAVKTRLHRARRALRTLLEPVFAEVQRAESVDADERPSGWGLAALDTRHPAAASIVLMEFMM